MVDIEFLRNPFESAGPNWASPIGLHITYGCVTQQRQHGAVRTETLGPTKPKQVNIQFFTEKKSFLIPEQFSLAGDIQIFGFKCELEEHPS